MKAVIDSFIPYAAEALAPYFEIESMRGDAMTAADVADADVLLVRTRTVCDAAGWASHPPHVGPRLFITRWDIVFTTV